MNNYDVLIIGSGAPGGMGIRCRMEATRNSYEFVPVVSQRSRGANGAGEFWYQLY